MAKQNIMPFKSEAQRRYLWKFHPEIAKRWEKEHPNQGDLPLHKSRLSKVRKGLRKLKNKNG